MGKDRLARRGQLGPTRSFAGKQRYPQLRLKRRNPVTDRRNRPPEPFRRRMKAAFLLHGKEDRELVQRWAAYIHRSKYLIILNSFI